MMGMAGTMWEKEVYDKSLPDSLSYCGPKNTFKN